MATATEIYETLQIAIAESPGIKQLTVDGMQITIDPAALTYWARRAAEEARKRPGVASINLTKF